MTKPGIVIRRVGADERADWEPLWKGYQTFRRPKAKPLTLTGFPAAARKVPVNTAKTVAVNCIPPHTDESDRTS
jgi:hypothetical protein